MRVHEIAKELNIPSKEICAYLSTDSKNFTNFSGLSDDEVKRVRGKYGSDSKSQTSENKDNVKKDSIKPDSNYKQRSKTEMNTSEEKKNRNNNDNRNRERSNGNQRNSSGDKKNGYNHNNNGGKKFGSRPDNRNKSDNRNGEGRDGQRDNRNNNGDFRKNNNGDKKFGDRNQNGGKFDSNRNGGAKNNDRKPASDDMTSKNGKNPSRKFNNNNNSKFSKDKEKNKGKNRENDIAALDKPKKEKKEEVIKTIILPDMVTIKEIAEKLKLQPAALIKKLFLQGKVVTINDELTYDEAEEIALEYNVLCEHEVKVDVIAELLKENDDEDDESKLTPRPPVVAVMGHVDHGKTSLLDYIRKSNVIAGEAGGITQHIGAYNVKLPDGRRITFLDTPGHEAFTAMRARGAQLTDLAIIIIAADDAVMPQTVEAINHAQAAGVPMVFAINKIDKPGAQPERIYQQLAQMNILTEAWGGKYQCQEISAKKGLNVDKLLEKVLLETDLLDLKANPNKNGVGAVIESSLDKGRGYLATVLVQDGTLKTGDMVLSGSYYGRVKAMFNERGQKVKEAGPSTPVSILGLNGAPSAGDKFNVMSDEKEAKAIANKREQLLRIQGIKTQKHMTLEEIGRRIAIGNFKELNVIVKGDVDGSVEALSDSLIKLSTEQVRVNVIHKAVGAISESDVILAEASDAVIIGFQVRPSTDARKLADEQGIEIRLYSVIYDAINDVKDGIEGMLEPIKKEEITGTAEVKQTFKISKVGTIAGCLVRDGKIAKTAQCRLIRDGIVVYTGELASLKRGKDDVKEVSAGMECGIGIDKFNDLKVGDNIEAFVITEIKQTLD